MTCSSLNLDLFIIRLLRWDGLYLKLEEETGLRTGKIERWHQTLKNRVLLENHYLPGALEDAVGEFVDHYNHRWVHESLGNVTSADTYFGRAPEILKERRKIKEETIQKRRLLNKTKAP